MELMQVRGYKGLSDITFARSDTKFANNMKLHILSPTSVPFFLCKAQEKCSESR